VPTLADDLPADAEVFAIDVEDATLSATIVRSRTANAGAPTALLVPGFTGSKEDFYPFLGPLADGGFDILTYSQRGQFDSTGPVGDFPPTSTRGYELGDFSRDVHRVLDRLGLGRVHLLGHSFGGVVGIDAAILDPSRFLSYTLWNSGPVGQPWNTTNIAALRAGGNVALWALEHDADEVLTPEDEWYHRRMLADNSSSLLGAATVLHEQTDRTEDLAATGLPLLVSHGDVDDAWPIPLQRDMAQRLGARYAVVPGAGHVAQADNPRGSADILIDFWSSIPS
jgi:pimeloyl-ACP methyl ester carboxylesterase